MSLVVLTLLRVFVIFTLGFFIERVIHTPSALAHLRQRRAEDLARMHAINVSHSNVPGPTV